MKFTLNVERKTFVNAQGEAIEYNECIADIGGTPIKFAPKASDKSLFDFLLSQIRKPADK